MTARRPDPLLAPSVALALAGAALMQYSGTVETGGKALLALAGLIGGFILVRAEPVWPISIGVALTIFSGNWDLIPVPIALDRIVIGIGLISLLGRATSRRDVFGREPSPIHWLIGLAALYALGSAYLAGALDDANSRFALLDRYGFVPFVLFATAPAVFATSRQRRILLGVLTGVGAYLAYVSIVARIGPDSLVKPHYIVDPSVGEHADRARGPFIEAGANGLGLFECGVAAVMLATEPISNRLKVLAGVVALACALSIEFTLTRSVWIGSAIALAVTMVASPYTRRYLVPVGAASLMVVFGALSVVPGLRHDADQRSNDKRPIWDRRNANDAALRMIDAKPLVGFGWGQFRAKAADYHRINGQNRLTRADLQEHNVFLSNAVELGLIGVTIWGLALVCAIGGAIFSRGPPELTPWRIGLIAIAAQWFVVANFVPLGYAFPNALLWLWAGVASARPQEPLERIPVATTRPTPEPTPRPVTA